jgi:hypothetical protein
VRLKSHLRLLLLCFVTLESFHLFGAHWLALDLDAPGRSVLCLDGNEGGGGFLLLRGDAAGVVGTLGSGASLGAVHSIVAVTSAFQRITSPATPWSNV